MSVNEWVLEKMDVLEETVRSYEAVKLRIKEFNPIIFTNLIRKVRKSKQIYGPN